jgi:heme/copper-type cytochrome/quinol oxidase subunit 2
MNKLPLLPFCLLAGAAFAQPAMPGQGPSPAENWFGPILLPLIMGTVGLIALIAFLIWRIVARVRRRQGPPLP